MIDRFNRRLLRRLPIDAMRRRTADGGLRRALNARDLIALGVGVIVGGGIFTTIGPGVHKAGPAVTIAFLLAGAASLVAALCYAELATIMPSAGSAYAFTYGAFGQLFGWIIGWNLVLEYTVGTAPVAQQFSQSLQEAVAALCGLRLPPVLAKAALHGAHSSIDVVAAAFIAVLTLLIALGIQETARVNNALVIVKVLALMVFIVAGSFLFDGRNLHPFNPVGWLGPLDTDSIPTGIFGAGALVFFTYIGFDVVTTTVEECRDPGRDMPIGVIGSLLVATILYCAVAVVLVGAVPWRQVNVDTPLQSALEPLHLPWASWITRVGVLAGTSSVALVSLLGQSRVFFAMSRDKLLPRAVAAVSPHFKTPFWTTIVAGGLVAVFALIVPLDALLASQYRNHECVRCGVRERLVSPADAPRSSTFIPRAQRARYGDLWYRVNRVARRSGFRGADVYFIRCLDFCRARDLLRLRISTIALETCRVHPTCDDGGLGEAQMRQVDEADPLV